MKIERYCMRGSLFIADLLEVCRKKHFFKLCGFQLTPGLNEVKHSYNICQDDSVLI